jgi:hypothetical protein
MSSSNYRLTLGLGEAARSCKGTGEKRRRKDNIMLTDPQILQVIYLAIVRYFAAKRQQKQAAIPHDDRTISTNAPRVTHGASVTSDGGRSPVVQQAAARQ